MTAPIPTMDHSQDDSGPYTPTTHSPHHSSTPTSPALDPLNPPPSTLADAPPPAADELPPYAPPTPPAHPPPTRRARNLLSALDTLRLPPSVNAHGAPKRCTLTHHLALFDELVSRLEGEGVHMSPTEKGWALVRSCPGLRLMDVWFNICGTHHDDEAWIALLDVYFGLSGCSNARAASGKPRSASHDEGMRKHQHPPPGGRGGRRSSWMALIGF